ncbi:MAG: L-aspartate oxidase [candidate division Zixibacteria bacterium DG_27]|nr:MAG: L-aspartate oxidase [candidate division Zixibacteria bacterium DG_27]
MQIESDFLIIGSGIAGLSYALEVAKYGSVNIITKKEDTEATTNYAQGGIAAVSSKEDSFEAHIEDTLKGGAGLCNPEVVAKVVEAGPRCIQRLKEIGVQFSTRHRGLKSRFDLGIEGGHSHKRVVHAADFTGREIEKGLLAAIAARPNIKVYENHLAIDLLTQHQLGGKRKAGEKTRCWGAYVLDTRIEEVKTFTSKITLLATGGAGRVYSHTTNPEIATGDGIAMAYRAGAAIANMEFVQFHPTMLYHPEANSFLISEAVRGEGGKLRLKDGKFFMQHYDPRRELASRDVVARAIDAELKRGGDPCVFLDITHLPPDFIKERFPRIYQRCSELNLDITGEWIPVVPAAHYICGGVRTDSDGQSSIENLWAIGEVASTGMHGANRLASNSLLEAVAFAEFASQDSIRKFKQLEDKSLPRFPDWSSSGVFDQKEWVIVFHDRQEIPQLMWDYVGIVRSNYRLDKARERLGILSRDIEAFYRKNPVRSDLIELRNIATVAELIVKSARMRRESRGLHFNLDYPERDDRKWLKETLVVSPEGEE